MKKYFLNNAAIFLVVLSIIITSWKTVEIPKSPQILHQKITADSLYNQHILSVYHDAHLDSAGLNEEVFEKAITGYYNMQHSGLLNTKSILTIADFDQLSSSKRLYIIDLENKKLILNTWVAHGQNSGGNKPSFFSNTSNSYQSSLGFYLTGEIYNGKHGRSLRLDGMDRDFNSNARERAIVIHGASYVGQETINKLGRLGRSQGCPAVPQNVSNKVISTISDRTVLFINSSDENYHSNFLDENLAANMVMQQDELLEQKD